MHALPILLLSLLPQQAETVRSVLSGPQPGSLEKPLPLDDVEAVAQACRQVSQRSPVDPEDDTAEGDLKEEEWEAGRKVTFARVYRATVDPKQVRFGPHQGDALPLSLERSLPAMDGGLLLNVSDREGAAFPMTREEAKGMVERAEKKQLQLAVTFQVDGRHAHELSPCWTYPKSESFSMRVLPLRYELMDLGGKVLASSTTSRLEELTAWLAKGGPESAISTAVVKGVVDQEALDKALAEKKGAVDACLAKAGETASFGLVGAVGTGRLGDLRVEMEASDDPQASTCIISALSGVPAPRASKDAVVSVIVSAD